MQQLISPRRRSFLVRFLTVLVVVVVGAAFLASPAAADQPVKSTYPLALSGTITDVCSFPITNNAAITVTETDFFDANGALTSVHQHQVEQDTFTANGKTLVSVPFTFNFDLLFDSSGNVTHVYSEGVAEKVPLPDGSLFISAGRVDFMAHPGVMFILSPDHGHTGDIAAFCAALSQ